MRKFEGERVGIREKGSDKLIAVYPHSIDGNAEEVADKVLFWYYQQDCSTGERLEKYYVDSLSETELKALQ
ncbi:MAG: hypothetical protein N3B21_09885 [Clostridia bacterium]|nr:hypothetical protein [Clostridia bacterium]